jgi:hypothetical protein
MRQPWAIAVALCLLSAAVLACAQDEEVPLGDLARSVRKSKPAESQPEIIDNDNMTIMMDKAEAKRLDGKPVFSIDPSGKAFSMTSPDGTCSLSFDAKAAALITTPYIASDVPQYELAKLEGAAAVHDGVLEITLHNGTDWELKEIMVGVTLLNASAAQLQPARLVTASDFQADAKPPDLTTIYHIKNAAPADSIKIFRAVVSDDFVQSKEWHWALVGARGVPPAAPIAAPSEISGTQVQPSVIAVQPTASPAQPGVTSTPPNATSVPQSSTPAPQSTTKPVFSDSPGASSAATASQAVAQPSSSSSTSPHR